MTKGQTRGPAPLLKVGMILFSPVKPVPGFQLAALRQHLPP